MDYAFSKLITLAYPYLYYSIYAKYLQYVLFLTRINFNAFDTFKHITCLIIKIKSLQLKMKNHFYVLFLFIYIFFKYFFILFYINFIIIKSSNPTTRNFYPCIITYFFYCLASNSCPCF